MSDLAIAETVLQLPTYPVLPTTSLPVFFDAWHCHPYRSYCQTSSAPVVKSYRAVVLENGILRATVVPDLGGRLFSLVDKRRMVEVLYRNDVVKPVRILPRLAWISGGIEFNFPITHSPTSLDRVGFRVPAYANRVAVQVGETERKFGLQWVVELSLGPGEDFLAQRSFLSNPTPAAQAQTVWFNAAVRATPRTEFVYPRGKVLIHTDRIEIRDWPDSYQFQAQIPTMTDIFWLEAESANFGVFHHEEGFGLAHLSSPGEPRGMKVWSYGTGDFAHWATLCTDDGRPYAEIQAGLHADLLHPLTSLQPGEERTALDFWRPLLDRREFDSLSSPEPDLPPPDLEWLGNDHVDELRPWQDVVRAFQTDDASRLPRDISSLPPTGLDLEAPLRWAATKDDRFKEHLGAYLCGLGRYGDAISALRGATAEGARYLRGLLHWKAEGKLQGAKQEWQRLSIDDAHFICRHDELLAELGETQERRSLLEAADLSDPRLAERYVDLLLAEGKPGEALALLERTRWPPIHEHYVRTKLWRRAREALGMSAEPVPLSLGEDNLRPLAEVLDVARKRGLL